MHSLAGTILIDSEQKRLAKVSGQLINLVTFGFGLLGRIDSGTLEFERVEVGPQQWKTAFINIHFSGRAVIFKTSTKTNMSGDPISAQSPATSASPTPGIF
jgi:hypothetical protein